MDLSWRHRGYDNAVAGRRRELLDMAKAKIQALEAKALVDIGLECLEAQTKLAASGLTSEAAQAFLAGLSPIEKLMPMLSFEAVAGKAKPPIAEQLISSNALRQRRFRERQAALRSGVTGNVTSNDGDDGDDGGDDDDALDGETT